MHAFSAHSPRPSGKVTFTRRFLSFTHAVSCADPSLLPQYLEKTSITAFICYFNYLLPFSWELLRSRAFAFLIVSPPAPSTVCDTQWARNHYYWWTVFSVGSQCGNCLACRYRCNSEAATVWDFLPFSLSSTSVQKTSPSLIFMHDLVQCSSLPKLPENGPKLSLY